MKRVLLPISLLALGIVLTGCVVAIGTRNNTPPHSPPAVVVTDSADVATIAEIDAAAQLNMDGDRTQALGQIAERPLLPVPVQVHLINTAYRRLNFEDSKVQVLRRMIARPDFCDATRHAIVSQLNRLSFDGSRQQLLQQINERLKSAPAQ